MTALRELKVLESPDQTERVVITLRSDGIYTYQQQWWQAEDAEWGALGPECGLYDSSDTAELEARLRVPWLRAQFH